jgi:hypothetical protein
LCPDADLPRSQRFGATRFLGGETGAGSNTTATTSSIVRKSTAVDNGEPEDDGGKTGRTVTIETKEKL